MMFCKARTSSTTPDSACTRHPNDQQPKSTQLQFLLIDNAITFR
jgi:hypothetical protein